MMIRSLMEPPCRKCRTCASRLERRWDGMVRANEIGRVDDRLDPAQAVVARAREELARPPPRAGDVEVRVVGLPGLEDAAQLPDRLLDGRRGLGERGHPD